jgi:hypothetical protein
VDDPGLYLEYPQEEFQPAELPWEPRAVELVIVEDSDSYSIIDMSTGSPLISYMRKDTLDDVGVTSTYPAVLAALDDQS